MLQNDEAVGGERRPTGFFQVRNNMIRGPILHVVTDNETPIKVGLAVGAVVRLDLLGFDQEGEDQFLRRGVFPMRCELQMYNGISGGEMMFAFPEDRATFLMWGQVFEGLLIGVARDGSLRALALRGTHYRALRDGNCGIEVDFEKGELTTMVDIDELVSPPPLPPKPVQPYIQPFAPRLSAMRAPTMASPRAPR